jgi:prepilin signal peptidase PulO-like enzyme (type II secretory pathway)
VADDYAYLAVKFLGFGLWLPGAKKFIAAREINEELSNASEKAEIDKSRSEVAAEIESDEEQTGMGQGDAKLALMIGANLLLPLSLVSFFLAVMSGTVIGIIMTRGRGGAAIPFGPFLAVGALASLLWGQELLAWYIHYAHL